MLKHIYADNYKSLVNFELDLDSINLFLGMNGSGKSAVFEVLLNIHYFLAIKSLVVWKFESESRTRWQNSPLQTIELTIDSSAGEYIYKLIIEFDEKRNPPYQVKTETLLLDGQPLLEFAEGEVQLYRDDGSKGSLYPFDQSLSAVALQSERNDNIKLTAFKHQMSKLLVVHPIPGNMSGVSSQEDEYPLYDLENFVSWYRYLMQDGSFVVSLTDALREVIPDFDSLFLDKVGREERLLMVRFINTDSKQSVSFEFDELSDGQRMLIVLYTFLCLPNHAEFSDYKVMLCLDEPENFVALREIQPWLTAIHDRSLDGDLQLLLISHHPEIINYLLMPNSTQIGYWFARESNLSPTRVTSIKTSPEQDGLSPAELIARGWLVDGE